jgi:hypothetical protein
MSGTSRKTAFEERAEFKKVLLLLVAVSLILLPRPSSSGELTGRISPELWLFQSEPLYEGQERHNASLALQSEYYYEFESGSSITFVSFFRYDGADSERTHFDVREMNYDLILDNIEFRAGAGKVFWGATEFVHLVDIINQTDLVENLDGEDKLGQPMVQLIMPRDWGTFEFFILPYFRERTFPGEGGRLRNSIPVDTDNARYEHPDKERHIDIASRFSGTVGILDFGLSYFKGTGREPTLIPVIASDGSDSFVPFYEQIDQGSVDLQAVMGAWLLKLETFRISGQGKAFYSYSSGFEYTFTGVWRSRSDLGIISEYAHDSRKSDSTSAFQNDIMIGLRLALNDFSSTEVLLGYIYDTDYDLKILRVEGSRRIGNNLKLSLETGVFFDIGSEDILYDVMNDDYMMVRFSYYL